MPNENQKQKKTKARKPMTDNRPDIYFKYRSEKGTAIAVTENTQCMLDGLQVGLKYNEITKKYEYTYFDGTMSKLDADDSLTVIRNECIHQGYGITRNTLRDHLRLIGDKNSYNPVCDYLKSCYEKYKYSRRLDWIPWLVDSGVFVLNPEYNQDPVFVRKILEKWFIGAAMIAFNDGSNAMQIVLTLQGRQGAGKSSFFRNLVPSNGMYWVKTEKNLNPDSKDSVMENTASWLVENSEAARFMKKGKIDTLKGFYTASRDNYRRPYDTAAVDIPRKTAFAITTNDTDFLKDSTGERRFGVVCVDKVDGTKLNENVEDNMTLRDLIWGQAMHLWKCGRSWYWESQDDLDALAKSQANMRNMTEEESTLRDAFDFTSDESKYQKVTIKDLQDVLNNGGRRLGTSLLGKALTQLASEYPSIKKSKSHADRFWLVPPFRSSDTILDKDVPF